MSSADAPREHLPAALVIDGLWETAPVVATMPGHPELGAASAVAHAPDESGGGHWTFGLIGERHEQTTADGWQLSLRLPGPLGCGLHGLERHIQKRLGGVEVVPEWCRALPAAEVSKRLVMLDALAGTHVDQDGIPWPTGAGAPVYGWERPKGAVCWVLSGPDGSRTYSQFSWSDVCTPALEGITDPMAALTATWKQECAR